MGKSVVGAVLLGCIMISQVAIAASADSAQAGSRTPPSLEQVNEQLQGKVAFIELVDGTTIKKAKGVVMEPNFTYWTAKGNDQNVETAEVRRIRARSKSKGLIGLGAGAATGGLIALATKAGETTCNEIEQCTSDATSEQLGFLVAVGAGVGFGVSKAIPNKQTVVYEAPHPPATESNGSPDVSASVPGSRHPG